MSVLELAPRRVVAGRRPRHRTQPRRAVPTLAAGVLAAVYVIVSPPSLDLAAHLFRARLFSAEGFGVWNNWWYGGHHTLGYSVLFPPGAAALSPQLAGALAATATAALFEVLVHRHFGREAWLGALWFGAATATNLYTGRLTFAFGLLPAVGAALALQRGRPRFAGALAVVTALASPVAALFAALAGAAYAVTGRGRRTLAGGAVAAAALAPVLALSLAFPDGGAEPFAFSTLWPIPLVCLAVFYAFPRHERAIRAGAVLYALLTLAAYLIPSPVGSNVARLGPLLGGPLLALALWPARRRLLVVVAIPLLYLALQAPIRDVAASAGDPSTSAAYWQPLLAFLGHQPGPPFRVEIPFTALHWESYEVAPRYALARGWERQLDTAANPLFYAGRLTAARYAAWLRRLAVRFVAVPDGGVDDSARQERALIDRGLPYLRLLARSKQWRIYGVRDPTPVVQGAARLIALGPDSLSLQVTRPGTALARVRFTPYWALSGAAGCVSAAGGLTRLQLRRPGPARLVIRFSLARVGAQSPRCGEG